jgi:hypothetical protein
MKRTNKTPEAATDDAAATLPSAAPAPAPAPEPSPVWYEVLVPSVKIGGAICYRTARVRLTKAAAEALNAAQPNTVRFLGI